MMMTKRCEHCGQVIVDEGLAGLFADLPPEGVRRVFRKERLRQGQSGADVGKRANYSRDVVGLLENGHWYPKTRVGFETLARLVVVGLGMDVGRFVRQCGKSPPPQPAPSQGEGAACEMGVNMV